MTGTERAAPGSAPVLAQPSADSPIVEFDSVSVAYHSRIVVDDVTFKLAAGERVALVGPNGAGKSSLLRALAGLVPVRGGMISLEGRPLESYGRAAVARRISAVPAASLPFSMLVEEVVALGRLPHEDPIRGLRPADRAAVAAAIERVGLRGRRPAAAIAT